MAIRQYLSTVIGSGSLEDPKRPVWHDILFNLSIFSGTVINASSLTVTLNDSASTVDDFYTGERIVQGDNNKLIVNYIGATRQAIIGSPWDILPIIGASIRIPKPYPIRYGQAIDSKKYNFWIGLLDTDDTQHAALQAAGSVRFVPDTILDKTYGSVSQGARDAINEIFTWLDLEPADQSFAPTCTIKIILKTLVGHVCYQPVEF